MPNYEVELGDERHLPNNLEPYLPTVGGSLLGVILSTPYYGVTIDRWAGGVWGSGGADTTLDDRVVVSLPSDVEAANLSAQGWVQWVAPLDPSATYTAGVPTYPFTIGAIGGSINIEFVRAGSVVLSETVPSGETRTLTLRHGDEGTLLECVPDAGYTFDHWEFLQYILQDGQSVENPDLKTSTDNPHTPPNNKWVAHDAWRSVVAVLVGPEERITPWSAILPAGNYRVTFPEAITVNGITYPFINWQDLPETDPQKTNPVRTVTLAATDPALSMFAQYITPTPLTHILTVSSIPVVGVPLILDGTEYVTPVVLEVQEGSHILVVSPNLVIGTNIYNFLEWEDRSTNPTRTINLVNDVTITARYELAPPPPPNKSYIEIHAFKNDEEIVIRYEIVGVTFGNTPDKVEVDAGTYTVTATYDTETKPKTVQALEGQTIRVDFQFAVLPPYNPLQDLWNRFVEFSENFGLPVPPKPPIP